MTRTLSPEVIENETNDYSLRPDKLSQFIGQNKICENLRIYMNAAKSRDESIDHVLFSGAPGLGKTTLSQIIAEEMGCVLKTTSAPLLTKPGDIAALLTGLEQKSVLFIDEIHRLPANVEELLYSAMEDFKLDLLIGEGPSARVLEVKLSPFTLVGATTKLGSLSRPLRDRFGISFRLDYYNFKELYQIILRAANLLTIQITEKACMEIAKRARGTPRIACRILKRVRDYNVSSVVDFDQAVYALEKIGIDLIGLDCLDRKYLQYLMNSPNRIPVGLDTIAAALSESKETIEDVVEPYLLQQLYIQRTPRGRIITDEAVAHLVNGDLIS